MQEERMGKRHGIFALATLAAMLSWGCPEQNTVDSASNSSRTSNTVEQTPNDPVSVPEPATLLLLTAGVCGVSLIVWKKRSLLLRK
jgi:hypothetical protein